MRIDWPILFLALIAPLAAYLMARRGNRQPLRFSSLTNLRGIASSWRMRLRPLLIVLRMACIILLVIALARPQKNSSFSKTSTKGVAMELVVDRSGSMDDPMEYDGQSLPRFDVLKKVLKDFVKGSDQLQGRDQDLLGLITFARYSDTLCPLVTAHDALLGFLDDTETVKTRSENATAIGDAIALAAARLDKAEQELAARNEKLKASVSDTDSPEAKPEFVINSKVIVLLTDGDNNAGDYEPTEAVELAKKLGIKIYTIGVGGPTTVQTFIGPQTVDNLNERLLSYMAKETGGFYSRAVDGESLLEICKQIDEQEKTEIEVVAYSNFDEQFLPWALAALIVLCLELLLANTIFRKIP